MQEERSSQEKSTAYAWTPNSKLPINDFTKKYLPSKISTKETEWIWVQADRGPFIDPEIAHYQESATQDAKNETDQLFDRLMDIKNDENIPVRREEGSEVQTKAEKRKTAHERTVRLLKVIMRKNNWLQGKCKHSDIDKIWQRIASSVAVGPLNEAGVKAAKVETTRMNALETEGDGLQHQVYLYIPNVLAVPELVKVLETLISCHGIIPTGVKPDLYSAANISSQHPTRINSLVFRPRDHPKGQEEIERLYRDFVEYEEIFGFGSRDNALKDLLEAVEVDYLLTPQSAALPPSSPDFEILTPSAPAVRPIRIRLENDNTPSKSVNIPTRRHSLIKHLDIRPVHPLPPRFSPIVKLEPTAISLRTPRNMPDSGLLMKDYIMPQKRTRPVEDDGDSDHKSARRRLVYDA